MPTAELDVAALRAAAAPLEPDRALAATLAPVAAQPALMALAAFAAELRNVARAVREPLMGEFRLQWWRDALDILERGGTTGNPIADALGATIRTHALPKGLLLGVIDGRAADLDPDPWPDRRAMHATLSKTESALFVLAARVLGAKDDARLQVATDATGRAYGLTRLLTDLPIALSRGHLPLPLDASHGHAGVRDTLRNGTITPDSRVLLDHVASDARDTLATARQHIAALPTAQIAAFLPLVMVDPYLRCVLRPTRDPLRDVIDLPPLTRVWRMGWASWRRRI
jgi:15-cis-phytoene synthase